ncbi:MlaD family protein [Guyparkeria hydrothermalis]|uniref:MlaD family protein n=1 Tax=Guyparkeria TaxID=2035712 RepID=UPI0010AD16E1|nr:MULTISPECIES: MlaD family protein [Guyparkeria]MCL7751252.1 MlaD family protein [Guyparkeria hydrothermalis]TKA89608.1 MCE family protein [Guyparkeria sp. SB14A]
MESKVNYSIVGLFVVLLLGASLLTAWWLYSGGSSRQYSPYLVYATDSVSGLNSDSRVYYHGVDVGYVDEIRIDRNNPDNIRIRLLIDQTVPIRADTSAQLQPQGVTGLSVLNLKGGSAEQDLPAAPDACCPVIPYEPSLFSKLEGGLNDTMVRLVAVSERIDRLLREENLAAIERTVTNLDQITGTLAEERETLRALMQNASRTAENTAELTESGERLLARAEGTMDSLDQAIGRVSGTMDTFEQTADRVATAAEATVGFSQAGERAADEISRQTLPDMSLLIRDLRDLSRRLSEFTTTLDDDPSRALFGGDRRAPGPGEANP